MTERAFDNPRFVEDVVREALRGIAAMGVFESFFRGSGELREHPQPQRLRVRGMEDRETMGRRPRSALP